LLKAGRNYFTTGLEWNAILKISPLLFNPLSANVMHGRHDTDVTCSDCSASYRSWWKVSDVSQMFQLYYLINLLLIIKMTI